MLDNIEWFLVFICIYLFFIILCLNDIKRYNNDRNHSNKRKYNLRKASYAENSQNHSKRKDNTSGITGVTFNKHMNKWQVCININKKRRINS